MPSLSARRSNGGPANPGDGARVSRALEVMLATGRSILDWHEDTRFQAPISSQRRKFFYARPRRTFRRIDARFDAMIEAGAIEEVRALRTRSLDPGLPAMKAHGVPWLIRQLKDEITLAEAAEGAKRDTRQYTKRQATWFRNQLPEFAWVEPAKAFGRG